MQSVKGRIIDIKDGGAVIFAPLPNIATAIKQNYQEVDITFKDGRYISLDQRRKVYALMNEISEYTGDTVEGTKNFMKMNFIADNIKTAYKKIFSLSNCDMSTAREFISYLIDFIITHDIPTHEPLKELCDDVQRYELACLMHKKCSVCGRPAELHHVDAIGMGNNRTQVFQLGMRVLPLCRIHHSESHQIGQKDFLQLHHLQGTRLTKEIGKVYGLSRKNLGEG